MHTKVIARFFAVAAGALSVAGCQYSPDISERSIAYNRAVAESSNELFLLNAVRASKREPTFYSRIQSNTATGSITPSFTMADPLGVVTTVTSDAMGMITGRSLNPGAKSLSPTFSMTESNQLTLQNLDDQQYITGLMSSVPLQIFDLFSKEGLNLEELFLMFAGDIQINRAALRNLPNAMAEKCAAESNEAREANGDAPSANPNTYCKYFFAGRIPTPFTSYALHGAHMQIVEKKIVAWKYKSANSNLDLACFDGAAISDTAPQADMDASAVGHDSERTIQAGLTATAASEVVVFPNDPAVDLPEGTATPNQLADASKKFRCFQQVARALLALGLHVDSQSSHQLLYQVPLDVVKGNPRLITDLSQQSLEVAVVGDSGTGVLNVCKKGDTLGYKLSPDAYVAWVLGLTPKPKADDAAPPQPSGSTTPPVPQLLTLSAGAAGATNASDNCKSQVPEKPPAPHKAPTPVKALAVVGKVSFAPRSLEAMVYFIGQNIRRTSELGFTTPATFLAPTRDYRSYEEWIFRVDNGIADVTDSLVRIEHEGQIYSVPALCRNDLEQIPTDKLDKAALDALGPAATCSTELPDHASPQILTLLNQVWGLQKSVATLPAIPTVTLINP